MRFADKFHLCWLVTIAVIIAICTFQCARERIPRKGADDRVVSVLRDDFETLFFAEASLLRGDILSGCNLRGLQAPFGQLRVAFEQRELMSLWKELFTAKAAENVMVGARDFRAPAGLGPILSEKCYVIRLTTKDFDLKKFLALRPVADLKGKPIWTSAFRYGGEQATILASIFLLQPEPEYIVMATSLASAKDVASKLSSEPKVVRHGGNALPDFASSLIWGHREYRAVSESHTRVSGMVLGSLKIPPALPAFSFSLNPLMQANCNT